MLRAKRVDPTGTLWGEDSTSASATGAADVRAMRKKIGRNRERMSGIKLDRMVMYERVE